MVSPFKYDSWFFDELISLNDPVIIENEMSHFYRSNLISTKSDLINLSPERELIIEEAFQVHSQKYYSASTLLFLSIADGLCEGSLYSLKNNKKDLRVKFEAAFTVIPSVLVPLLQEDYIDKNNKRSKIKNRDLNRNESIHGVNFEFGNEINSLKALSLLCFVSDFYTASKNKKNPAR